jgi:hypothetical protein
VLVYNGRDFFIDRKVFTNVIVEKWTFHYKLQIIGNVVLEIFLNREKGSVILDTMDPTVGILHHGRQIGKEAVDIGGIVYVQ